MVSYLSMIFIAEHQDSFKNWSWLEDVIWMAYFAISQKVINHLVMSYLEQTGVFSPNRMMQWHAIICVLLLSCWSRARDGCICLRMLICLKMTQKVFYILPITYRILVVERLLDWGSKKGKQLYESYKRWISDTLENKINLVLRVFHINTCATILQVREE